MTTEQIKKLNQIRARHISRKSPNGMAFSFHKDVAEGGWITVNGTHIPVGENGELQGKVGKEIEKNSGEKTKSTSNEKSKSKTNSASSKKSESKTNSASGKKSGSSSKGHISPEGNYKNMMNEETLNECLKVTGKSMEQLYKYVSSNEEAQKAVYDELKKGTDWYTAYYVGAFPYIVSK